MTPACTVVLEVSSLHQTIQRFLQDLSMPSTCALLEVNKMENPVCDSLL